MDVWQYIEREKLKLPSIYFAHNRDIVKRDNAIVPITSVTPAKPNEKIENITVLLLITNLILGKKVQLVVKQYKTQLKN